MTGVIFVAASLPGSPRPRRLHMASWTPWMAGDRWWGRPSWPWDGPWKVSLDFRLPDDPIRQKKNFLRVIPMLTHYSHSTWKCVCIIVYIYIYCIYIYIYICILLYYINSIFVYTCIYSDILSGIYSDILSSMCSGPRSTASWTRFGVPVPVRRPLRLELC